MTQRLLNPKTAHHFIDTYIIITSIISGKLSIIPIIFVIPLIFFKSLLNFS